MFGLFTPLTKEDTNLHLTHSVSKFYVNILFFCEWVGELNPQNVRPRKSGEASDSGLAPELIELCESCCTCLMLERVKLTL